MELPKRSRGDEFTQPGEYPALRDRLRRTAAKLNVPTAVVYAFDTRTRLLPYLYSSKRMAPAGVRAVGAALADSGFANTRVVLEQWTPRFRPSRARLDGKPIEMLLVSSMQIHAERAYDLVRDAWRASPRPLIIAGGPKAIYEPWDMLHLPANEHSTNGHPATNGDGARPAAADVAVTGEEFVLVQLLELLTDYRSLGGTMLDAFRRARREGALENIQGLMYREDESPNAPLIDTGVQRLVQNLDEMPHPILGYRMLEPPHWRTTLSSRPLADNRIRRYTPVGSLTMSHGCKFNCDYCPIPAYNQRTFRHKSGERLLDEMRRLREEVGIGFFFGTDDNFFNNRQAVIDMLEPLSRGRVLGKPIRKSIRWGTEATEFDTWKNKDLLPWARKAGLRAIWFGIEDLTATLIKKGQSVSKTAELFSLLNRTGICPMPMMMHHDGQPLYTRDSLYGLLNQVSFLRRHGAPTLQVTVLTPAVGTRSYEDVYAKGEVFDSVAGRKVLQYQFDGNHVVASADKKPWRAQLNVAVAYASFYNPINLIRACLHPSNSFTAAGIFCQVQGMVGLTRTAMRSIKWAGQLIRGPIERRDAPPGPRIPIKLAKVLQAARSQPNLNLIQLNTERIANAVSA